MTHTVRKLVTVPLVLAGLVLSPLSAPSLAAPPAVDACQLVTAAEVEQLVGKLKAPPQLMREEHTLTCEYVFVNAHHALELRVFPGEALARVKQFTKRATVPVAGFGKGAFLYRDAALGYLELWLKQGDTVLQVALKASPAAEETVKALAKRALSRL